jgi:uncharacterized protein (DUF1810 family)
MEAFMADLSRFKSAQEGDFARALCEIKGGSKQSCWMWYIFPQLKGLGLSDMAQYYGIDGAAEARAYMDDPLLGPRLLEITRALLSLPSSDPSEIMGYPDDLKLCSCLTLFEAVCGREHPEFSQALDRFFGGKRDELTLKILKNGTV